MFQRAVFVSACVLGCLGVSNIAWASPATRPLITQNISDNQRITLEGNTRPEARNPAYDRGAVPADFPMAHLWLQLKRSPEQEQALVTLIDQMHDPKSPNYHQWMTAKEFGQTFGLASSDIGKISGWLEGHGFKVDAVFTNRMVIEFSGTAGDVRSAFHTEIHKLDVNGEEHIANTSNPQIPAALATAVVGVVSLNDFRPHGDPVRSSPSIDANPEYTSGTTYNLVPADAQTIYNLAPIYAAGYTGQGQTIAVIEDSDDYSDADFTTYRSKFGLSTTYPSGNLVTSHPSGGAACADPGANGNDEEVELDAEMATAIAPSATVQIASCADTTIYGTIIAMQNLLNGTTYAPVMSVSYYTCEAVAGATLNATVSSTYQQAVAQGVSVFVASGDNASAGCEKILDPVSQNYAAYGINVSSQSGTAYNVSVGGTDFQDTSLGKNSTYWSSTNASNYGSAKSYIPEIPWDGSCASSVLWQYAGGSSALAYCNSTAGEKFLGAIGAGGGASSCFSGQASTTGDGGSGTCAGLPKPSWQGGVLGIPADGVRDQPDVSLFAASGTWSHSWTLCYSDPGTNRGGTSCAGAPSSWVGVGGTSASTPVMAAIQTLIDQKYGLQGNPNYVLYALAAVEYGGSGSSTCNSSASGGPASTCVFYDITVGDNDVNCEGTINCFLPQGQTNGLLSTSDSAEGDAFAANVGYDFATGIGSVNAGNLFSKWSSVGTGGLIGTSITLNVSAEPVAQNKPETLIANLAFYSGSAPTGAVTYTLDGGGSSAMTCTGTATPEECTAVLTSTLTAGTHSFTVNYAGSSSNWPSTATGSFTVTAATGNPTAPATGFVAAVEYPTGSNPTNGAPTVLMQASDGNYYGTTTGEPPSEGSVLFKLAAGTFASTVVHNFVPATEGGAESGVVEGPNGLLYGVTSYTGNGDGSVFYSVSTSGTFTAIQTFTQTQLYVVQSQMTLGSDGNFYVTSNEGGVNGQGSIMQISPTGTYNLLWSFSAGIDSYGPYGAVVEDTPGTFYGTSFGGGANNYGFVYKLEVTGGSATVTDIHDFDITDGDGPASTLWVGPNGNLYGMNSQGGPPATEGYGGTIFEITPSGTFTTLVDFTTYEFEVGSDPSNTFLLAGDGNFYGDEGEQPGGGGNEQATMWAMTPSGTFSLPNNTDGSLGGALVGASYALLQASDGTMLQASGIGGSSQSGDVVKLTFSPTLKGPVQVTTTGTYKAHTAFTLNYAVGNGYSETYQQCYGYVQGGAAGAGAFTGKLSGGTAQITPTVGGTYTYAVTCAGIESGFVTVTVAAGAKTATTTTVTADPNPVTIGQNITLTATVAGTSGTPTGSVAFSADGVALDTVPMSGGKAVLTAPASGYPAGSYTVTATYSGDSANNSSSGTKTVVLSTTKAATTTTVTSSKACVEIGSTATLNAQINGDYATGTLTFSAVGYTIGTANVTANASTGLSSIAGFTLDAEGAPAGSYVLLGSYGGDGNNAASSGSVPVVLMPAAAVTMTANPMTVASGGNVTFTAMVGCSGAVPTGTVKFEYSGINLEQVTLTNGVGTSEALNSTGYPSGQYQIYAVYSGDANYPTATSAAVTITLQ